MIEFEFTYPEKLIQKKYDWLKEFAGIIGCDKVTVKVIREYH